MMKKFVVLLAAVMLAGCAAPCHHLHASGEQAPVGEQQSEKEPGK